MFAVLTLLLIGFIFYNSVQRSSPSNARSKVIAGQLQSLLNPDGTKSAYKVNALVRKIAHSVEYFLLGIGLGGLSIELRRTGLRTPVSLTLFLSLLIGVLDEYIQYYAHRTSSLKDVLIDFGGAVCGLIVIYALVGVIRWLRRRNL